MNSVVRRSTEEPNVLFHLVGGECARSLGTVLEADGGYGHVIEALGLDVLGVGGATESPELQVDKGALLMNGIDDLMYAVR